MFTTLIVICAIIGFSYLYHLKNGKKYFGSPFHFENLGFKNRMQAAYSVCYLLSEVGAAITIFCFVDIWFTHLFGGEYFYAGQYGWRLYIFFIPLVMFSYAFRKGLEEINSK